MPPGVNRAPARTVAVPSVPPTRSMLTYERKVFILFGTIVIVLIGNQLLKAVGKAKRNGSLIDRLLADGTMADGLAVSLALALTVFYVKRARQRQLPTAAPLPSADNQVVPLPAERIEEAAAMTTAAFCRADHNAWLLIAGGAEATLATKHRVMRFIFERNLALRLRNARAVFERGQLVCCFMLVPPRYPDVSLVEMFMSGLATAPFRIGIGPTRRLLAHKSHYEATLRALVVEHGLAASGFCTLERMVTHPAFQSKGIGTRALSTTLAECDQRGWKVLLSTNEERNVRFYRKLGFEMIHHEVADVAGERLEAWFMLRKPGKQGEEKKDR